jgi:hypothetical protein
MNTADNALERLGLRHASKETARALGLSVRQCQRMHDGTSPVQATVALLLDTYIAHGVPPVGTRPRARRKRLLRPRIAPAAAKF